MHDRKQNPFSCKLCDKGFTTKFVYERHVTEHHKAREQSYDCSECEKRYTVEEFDATAAFKESRFSTFQHMNNSDCPANNDISKKNLH